MQEQQESKQKNAEGPKTDENGNVYDADYKVEDDNDNK